jgi:hypothetical protein
MERMGFAARSAFAIVFAMWSSGLVLAGSTWKLSSAAEAQSTRSSTAKSTLRMPWGRPDLSGVWNYSSMTPLERPAQLSGKSTFASKEEADEFAKRELERTTYDNRSGGGDADNARAYNEFWMERGLNVSLQTSLIIDPPSGRLPPLTTEGKERTAQLAARNNVGPNPDSPDSYQDLSNSTRCLPHGVPHTPGLYNNNVQIFQSPEYVGIVQEMVHDVQIVPLVERPHLAPSIRLWGGDSRGRWEGDTLVIDTTNFNSKAPFRGWTAGARLTERYTRIDAHTLQYEFTVLDSSTWTQPWTARLLMGKSGERIYEFACHEGNEGIVGVLKGARAHDDDAAARKHQ